MSKVEGLQNTLQDAADALMIHAAELEEKLEEAVTKNVQLESRITRKDGYIAEMRRDNEDLRSEVHNLDHLRGLAPLKDMSTDMLLTEIARRVKQ